MPQNGIQTITSGRVSLGPIGDAGNSLATAFGSYSVVVKSGIMAAGLAGASPILAFLWKPAVVPTSLCLVRRIRFQVQNLGTAFAVGSFVFDFLMARAFTVQDTGGGVVTLTANNAKVRTSFATTQAAIQASATATLTAGTRTLDANPFRSILSDLTTAAVPFTSVITDTAIWSQAPGEWPMILAPSGEGFVIQATVPATGTWSWACGIDWDEVPSNAI